MTSVARQHLLIGKRQGGVFDPDEYKNLLEKEVKALRLNAEVDQWRDAENATHQVMNRDTGESFHVNDVEKHVNVHEEHNVLPRERVDINSPARGKMLKQKQKNGKFSTPGEL